MPDFKIITDSGCDFTLAELEQMNVGRAPLSVLFKGELCDDFATDEERKVFYDAVRQGEMPTTSAVNPDGWATAMKPALVPLFLNMLSRFVIVFLPRSKCLNFMPAVTVHSNFGAQENKISHCFHFSPFYLP